MKFKSVLCLMFIIFIGISLSSCSQEVYVNTAPDEETAELRSDSVYILFINAGKADSALVVSGEKAYLIDTGEETSAAAIFSAMAAMGVDRLDGVFLTHTHSDHIGSAKTVCAAYPTDVIYTAEFSQDPEKLEKTAKKADVRQNVLRAGDRVEIGFGNYFEVIAPLEYNSDDDNDNSLVLMLCANGKKVLFTGDMQFDEENTLLSSGADVSAHLLKVGNHGNPDATGDSFAKAVSPEIAVISTDTSVDEDSANRRVLQALSMSEIYITQDSDIGILVQIDAQGNITLSDPMRKKTGVALEIISVSKSNQTVTIRNNGADADISGFFICSTKGFEMFVFPKGSVVRSGETVTVAASGYDADYIWNDDDNVWSKKKEDTAVLYDRYGNILSSVKSD